MAAMTVEMGETGVAHASDAPLQACGLGACVGLCLFETDLRLAVLAHVVLPAALPPSSLSARTPFLSPPGKCADTAVSHALAEIIRHGGQVGRVRAALVGGARIFTGAVSETGTRSRLEIGQRNVYALKEELMQAGIPLCAEDTGGHCGRTVVLDAGTGEVRVQPVGRAARLLTLLGPGQMPPGLRENAREGALAYGN